MKHLFLAFFFMLFFPVQTFGHGVDGDWKEQSFQEFFQEMQEYGVDGRALLQHKNTRVVYKGAGQEVRVEWFHGVDGSIHDVRVVFH